MPNYQFHFVMCEALLRGDSGKGSMKVDPVKIYAEARTGVINFPDLTNGVPIYPRLTEGKKTPTQFFLGNVTEVRPVAGKGYSEVDVVLEREVGIRANAHLSGVLKRKVHKAVGRYTDGFDEAFVKDYLAALRRVDRYVRIEKAPQVRKELRGWKELKAFPGDGFPERDLSRGRGRVD